MRLTHRMAIENAQVRADMIEASEFPDLAQRYAVYGVPLTVANDQVRLEGGAPEAYFVPRLLQELGVGLVSQAEDPE